MRLFPVCKIKTKLVKLALSIKYDVPHYSWLMINMYNNLVYIYTEWNNTNIIPKMTQKITF